MACIKPEPDIIRPALCGLSFGEIVKKAEAAAVETGFRQKPEIYSALNHLNGRIEERNSRKNPLSENLFACKRDGRFKVFLTSCTSIRVDNLIIATAIGYYFLHFKNIQKTMRPNHIFAAKRVPDHSSEQKVYSEALFFALAFLMPPSVFLLLEKTKNNDQLAFHFQVPVRNVMTWRDMLRKHYND